MPKHQLKARFFPRRPASVRRRSYRPSDQRLLLLSLLLGTVVALALATGLYLISRPR